MNTLSFDPRWVLHEDLDVVVVNKPAFVPSQSASGGGDDIVARLAAWLGARDGKPAYVGTHQRLDAMTSGVLIYARRPEANVGLARAFEKRQVTKTYTAVVSGKFRGERRLKHLLVEHKGVMSVTQRAQGAVHAESVARSVEVVGNRTLVQLDLLTGRMHQARVQLAAIGHPIVGDPLYGGEPAPRLFLHATQLGLEHPGTSKPVRYKAPVPPEFDVWLRGKDWNEAVYDDANALMLTLAWAREKRYALLARKDTDVCRLVNEEGDGLPKLAVDVYANHAVVQFYEHEQLWSDRTRKERVLDAVFALGFDGVYEKTRPKQANTVVDTRQQIWAPKEPVRGQAASDPMVVHENDVPYFVSLGDGLSTGIFLDQRDNRAWLKSEAGGARVLNLFAYHGAFGVAAAAGGAVELCSVDASLVALQRAKAGTDALSRSEMQHQCIADDVFAWLLRARKRGLKYDLIVCDPPSYSSVKGKRWIAADDYAMLAEMVFHLAAPGARVLFCTNHRKTNLTRFRKHVQLGASAAGIGLSALRAGKDPSDFPTAIGVSSHLKSVRAFVV